MDNIDIIIVIVYLFAIVVVGLLAQRKASRGIDSFFLGNRKLPWWVLGASGMASNTDIAGTMINTAFIYALGTKGFFIEIRGGVTLYYGIPNGVHGKVEQEIPGDDTSRVDAFSLWYR